MRSFIQKLTLNVQSYLDLFLHGSSSSFYNPWWYQQRYQEWSYWVENLHVSFGVPIKKAHKFEWYRKTCYRSSRQEVICEKSVLRNFKKFTGKHLCWNLFFNKVSGLRPATFLKKETLAQVLSCEYCEISKNTFCYRTPAVASVVKMDRKIFEKD